LRGFKPDYGRNLGLSAADSGAINMHTWQPYRDQMDKYSSAASRSFKTFIGELTAVAAGVHVGLQEAIPIIQASTEPDPWKVAAKKHDIIVDGLVSAEVVRSSARLNLVGLYGGFDLFLENLRFTFHEIQGCSWTQFEGDAPFTAIGRNTKPKPNAHIECLGAHRIAVMDHYRLARNAVAHPSKKTRTASVEFSVQNTEKLNEVREAYEMQTAPNDLDHLNFHDVKLLARLSLDITRALDSLFDPGDDRLRELLTVRRVDKAKSRERNHNALAGWLRAEFGIDRERARRIIEPYLTQELGG
jgi:hypothetical protein